MHREDQRTKVDWPDLGCSWPTSCRLSRGLVEKDNSAIRRAPPASVRVMIVGISRRGTVTVSARLVLRRHAFADRYGRVGRNNSVETDACTYLIPTRGERQ